MRPLYLEMTAFGSYADTTAVPFEKLSHGLCLVTGDTGAGKTTIFDAIVFALYGVASGRDRTQDMLHCDHVPKSTDTVVTLRFAQSGKIYTVTRRLHFSKKRGTEDSYGPAAPTATLWEPDGKITDGATKVTSRCEELLGLNAEQFRKIIMLAQGEFREFLNAESDKKNEILGKLFDNAPWLWYQELFAGARDALRTRRTASADRLQALLRLSLQLPPEMTDEEREAFLPGNPALLECLEHLIGEEEREGEEQRQSRDALRAHMDALHAQRGAAEAMNARFAELALLRSRLDTMEQQRAAYAQRQTTLLRAEAAYRIGRPAVARFEQADGAMNKALEELEQLKTEEQSCVLAVEKAQAAVEADTPRRAELAALEAGIHALEEQLPRYRELEERRKRRAEAEEAARAAASKFAAHTEKEERLKQELQAKHERFAALEHAGAEAQELRDRLARAREKCEELGGKNGLREAVASILQAEEKERSERGLLLRLTGEAGESAQRYNALYQRFLAGQAGLLAEKLREEITLRQEAECPVCRSRLCREHLPQLAALPAETPDRAAVDAARDAMERAEKRRTEKETGVKTLAASLADRRRELVRRAETLLPACGSWEALIAPGFLEKAIEQASKDEQTLTEAWGQAHAREAEREALSRLLPEEERALQALQRESEALRRAGQERDVQVRTLAAAIEEQENQLRFADAAAADAEKAALAQRREALARELEEHRTSLEEARRTADTVHGTRAEKEKRLSELGTEQAEALSAMDCALARAGFESPAAVEHALTPIGQEDGEGWLRTEQKALSDYESDRRHTAEELEKLEGQTAGKEPCDLTALDKELEALGSRYAQLDALCAQRESLLQNHRSVREQAAACLEELAQTESAWSRLDTLASLAVGTSGEGGKLSFDRYVMGAVFREILEMANRRMEQMSGGRYELVHKAGADRRNAKAGLEIEVLDHNTGLQRGAGSLSGGEAFFTSLALALGLSDVVQNHAGGKQMDALFIDEGFGTLSDDVLDKALEVLGQLTEGKRLVGIISHVDKLDESIPQKIRAQSGERGSTLRLELP